MIQNIDDLTSSQKEDFQKFVEIAHNNLNLWWDKGDMMKGNPLFLSLETDFSCQADVLNDILINFPIMVKDVYDKDTKKILQLISIVEIMEGYSSPSLGIDGGMLYCFRFKKLDNIEFDDESMITDLHEIDTKQLLKVLQEDVLDELKNGDFPEEFWPKK